MSQSINWNEVARIATTMTSNELHYGRLDCIKAGEAAWELEKAGIAVSKDQGYYLDESSIYAAEQTRRMSA
tara:strand:+ start:14216 stop:14428 length:213 start_codon:yes stop_codon:yes gene_type:complete